MTLKPGEVYEVSPGRGFYTFCARDARVEANHPTMAGAVGKPLVFAVGVVGAAALASLACKWRLWFEINAHRSRDSCLTFCIRFWWRGSAGIETGG